MGQASRRRAFLTGLACEELNGTAKVKRADDEHVDKVIEVVRIHLEQCKSERIARTKSPDRVIRTTKACDAILEGGGIRYAVEHTSLDSYLRQRLDTARFREVLVSLEQRLKGKLPDHVDVDIPVHAVPAGIDWQELSRLLESWIVTNLNGLPHDQRVEVQIPGVPFALGVRRERAAGPGSLFGMRVVPGDLREQRVQVLIERIEAKSAVLSKYSQHGFRTVLIIESDDAALTNREEICEDFQVAVKVQQSTDIDEVFLVETDTQPWCLTPLKIGEEIMLAAQPSWPTAPGYPLLPE